MDNLGFHEGELCDRENYCIFLEKPFSGPETANYGAFSSAPPNNELSFDPTDGAQQG